MSFVVREYSSVSEFIKSIDDELNELRKVLGELLRRLEELRVKAEQEKKLKELLAKLGGGSPPAQSNVIELKNVRLMLNPSPEQEVSALEQAIESINNKVVQLQAIRKDLEVLSGSSLEIRVQAIYFDGLPKIVILRM